MRPVGDGRSGVVLVALFAVLATLTLGVWEVRGLNEVTGDEPHYLVMADGIIDHQTLEQTAPYQDEFSTNAISAFPLGDPGAPLTTRNTHALEGPNGWFNVHNVGLPAVLAIPFALGETVGAGVLAAKFALIAIGAFVIWLTWKCSGIFAATTRQRGVAVGVAAIALPLLSSSSQVYPDVAGGAIALAAITRLAIRRHRRDDFPIGFVDRIDWALVAALAFLPWLHLRFGPVAALLAVTLAIGEWTATTRRWPGLLRLGAPLAVSLGALLSYNTYAFGNLTGPYSSGAAEASRTSAHVFVSLYVDQFQGMFVQNPALLLAVGLLPGFLRRHGVVGWSIVAVHLLLVIPNALHVNWFGGTSIAGRFGVSGAIVALPLAVDAVVQLRARLGTAAGWAAAGALAAWQAVQYTRFTFGRLDLLVANELGDQYQSFSLLPNRWPSPVRRVELISSYAPEIFGASVVAALLLVGVALSRSEPGGRADLRLHSVVPLAVFGALAVASVSAATLPIAAAPLEYPGSALPTSIGTPVLTGMVVDERISGAGVVVFGPAVPLDTGRYRFSLLYEASTPDADAPSTTWSVTSQAGRVIAASGALPPTDGLGRFDVAVDVDSEEAQDRFEFPVSWSGSGHLTVWRLEITRLSGP